MPVEDHAVHERVKIGSGFRYGCHNRKPFKPGYIAFDRQYRPDGTFVVTQKLIPHAMSETCRYDLAGNDPHCEGCHAPKDTVYLRKMAAL